MDLIKYISESKKKTIIKAYIQGEVEEYADFQKFGDSNSCILIGDYRYFENVLQSSKNLIKDYYIENNHRNSAIDLLNTREIKARIEPGSIIRDHVKIGESAIIMMGAILNIGSKIGKNTMIDMNAVIGGKVHIGDNCHIGAGSILAGVIEPASAKNVIIHDNVLIGANCVILEGVEIFENSIIGAGSVVTKDVLANSVYFGNPAKFIKKIDKNLKDKNKILNELRFL